MSRINFFVIELIVKGNIMKRERLLIITPDGSEKTVYALKEEENELNNLLKISLLEFFSIKDIQSPKLQNSHKTLLNHPLKFLKIKTIFNCKLLHYFNE